MLHCEPHRLFSPGVSPPPTVALDDAEQIYQGWKEHTDELRQDVKEKEEQASGILYLNYLNSNSPRGESLT